MRQTLWPLVTTFGREVSSNADSLPLPLWFNIAHQHFPSIWLTT